MNYWIVRGDPKKNAFSKMLIAGKSDKWRTAVPPKSWSIGDRIFFYASSPEKCIIGLGELEKVAKQKDIYGDIIFGVKYLTHMLDAPIHLTTLRQNAAVIGASFLKVGPAQTVLSLTQEQGEAMYRMVVSKNSQYHIWQDVSDADDKGIVDYIEVEKRDVKSATFEPTDLIDARKRVAASIVRRRGQPRFRQELLKAYKGKCVVTGYNAIDALEAAHIIQYLGPDTNHITNGLLLRSDIHTLFDLHLISVDTSTMTLVISPTLAGTSYHYLAGKVILLPDYKALCPNTKALDLHRKESGL